jgi:Fur family transcriptional regulator, ferric uptake regulator
MQQAIPPERGFQKLLRSRSLRCTSERQAVLRTALTMPSHFEAEDLLDRLRRAPRRVSRGTVYRTLKLLVECGLIREVAFVDRHAHYECVPGRSHHDHLICTGCGKVIEFSRLSLERQLREVCTERGFVERAHTIEVTGLCLRCARGGGKA